MIQVHRMLFPLLVLFIGIALMIHMIVVESEPGALPLLLVLIGAVWSALAYPRSRAGKG